MKKLQLTVFAAIVMSCSVSFGQIFTQIAPSDVGLGLGSNSVNNSFDVSGLLGLSANSVSLNVSNGFVSSTNDLWTVSESQSSTFTFSGINVDAFVQHGSNLGSEAFANGSASRDGMLAAAGETWTLISTLDPDYTAGQSGNNYFVDYTGSETNQLESNGVGFRWTSDQPATTFSVYSSNTTDLNNNYSLGFRQSAAVPEPTTGVLVALATGMFFVRRKRS